MVKTCGNCVYMLDDGDGCPFCVARLILFCKAGNAGAKIGAARTTSCG